jgi:thiol-disulfide isomerase/thioredoxin
VPFADGAWTRDIAFDDVTIIRQPAARYPATDRLFNPATGHDYQRINVSMPWHAAKEYCEQLGGHLATATSAEENEFIYRHFGNDRVCWLGATDEADEGVWRWITGERWDYNNWFRAEPSNSLGREHYLVLGSTTASIISNGTPYHYRFGAKWNDHAADGVYQGAPIAYPVCEWDVHDSKLASTPPVVFDQQEAISNLQRLLAEGQFNEVEKQLDAALKQRPDSPALQYFRVRFLGRIQDIARRQLQAYVDYVLDAAVKQSSPLDGFASYVEQLASLYRPGDASRQILILLDQYEQRARSRGPGADAVLADLAALKAVQLTRMGQPDAAQALINQQLVGARTALAAMPDDLTQILRMAALLHGKLRIEETREGGDPEPAWHELLTFLAEQAILHPASEALAQRFVAEHVTRARALSRTDSGQAAALLKRIDEYFEKAGADAAIPKQTIDMMTIRLRGEIETAQRMQALIGSDAVFPESVDAWINGDAVTPGSLAGKVVLLDFFSVWCGPCVATFPHLRQWHNDYGAQGLEIIGVTRYYQYGWDEDAQRPRREQDLAPEQERDAMERFLEHHDLRHRIAFVADSRLQEHYMVSGIPHAVVIDRRGKVRLFRVGSGEQNAHDLEEAIKACLAETR